MIKELVIFGGGGFAREVAWLVADINLQLPKDDIWKIVGFVEHTNERVGSSLNDIPIIDPSGLKKEFSDMYAVVAIGSTSLRERAVEQAGKFGLKFATLIHPEVKMDATTIGVGDGCIVCAGTILTVNIKIGDHVIINIDCTVGHDSVIEDFVTISPGCHLSGYTSVRRGAYLGTGAVTVEHHEIGRNAIVGAGAVVVKDIPPDVTAVGIPARPIK